MIRPAVRLLLVACLALTAVAACGDDDPGVGQSGSTTTTTTSSTTEGSGSTAGTTTAATTTGEDGPALEGAGTDDRFGPRQGSGGGELVGLRTGRNEGYDRVVFEFDDDTVPEWQVSYEEPPFTQDASGEPVEVEGEAFLVVVMRTTGYDMEAGEATYTGPDVVAGEGTERVVEVVETGDFERVMTWIVGLDQQVPFVAEALDDPARLVIDIAHEG